jgi:hypothetical protein
MTDFYNALDLIKANFGDSDFEGSKAEELIANAENILGIQFPPTYKEFVRSLGAGDIAGIEFYGIINNNVDHSSIPDAVWLTLHERRRSQLPLFYIVIGSTGEGNYHVIDLSRKNTDGESPVLEWSPGEGVIQQVALDFGNYMFQLLQETYS